MPATSRLNHGKVIALESSPGAATQVYDRLRTEIVSLRMEPGALVNRLKLQRQFGLSSTPVRDALMRLGEEGLVEIVAQSATRVSLIDIDKARQAQFLRRALEQEVVETVCASADRTVAQELKALVLQQTDAADREDLSLFDDLDREFHRSLFDAAGMVGLFHLVRRQSGHIDRIRRLHLPHSGKMQEVIRDHGKIVKALVAGDASAARLTMRDHLSRSLAYSPKLREQNPSYFKP
jgi:DNA-binding GntR family transcriptional regulator